jgi:hypothetical protein
MENARQQPVYSRQRFGFIKDWRVTDIGNGDEFGARTDFNRHPLGRRRA